MHAYLACFDISDDRQRRTVSRKLEHYGLRVQYSVFEISVMNPLELETLKQELKQAIEVDDDIRFYHLCKACRKKSTTVEDKRIAQYPLAVVI